MSSVDSEGSSAEVVDGGEVNDDEEYARLNPNNERIINAFCAWWEELDRTLYRDRNKAIKAMHILAKFLEDARWFDEQQKDSSPIIVRDLLDVVGREYAYVADSCFNNIQTTTDENYHRAMSRLLLAIKQQYHENLEDFYNIFPQESIEVLIQDIFAANEQQTITNDDLFELKVGYIAGEFLEDTDVELLLDHNKIASKMMNHLIPAIQSVTSRKDELQVLIQRKNNEILYFQDISAYIPVPTELETRNEILENTWLVDRTIDRNDIEYHLTSAVCAIRMIAAISDNAIDVLPILVEKQLLRQIFTLLDIDYFILQITALNFFSTALSHQKIALDFLQDIDDSSNTLMCNGFGRIIEYTRNYRTNHPRKYSFIAPYISFIMVAFSKHTVAMEMLINSVASAKKLVEFAVDLLDMNTITISSDNDLSALQSDPTSFANIKINFITSLDTHLNIIEWFGEAFSHPLILTVLHSYYQVSEVNSDGHQPIYNKVIAKISEKLQHILLNKSLSEKSNTSQILIPAIMRETTRALFRYITYELYWAVEYDKGNLINYHDMLSASNVDQIEGTNVIISTMRHLNMIQLDENQCNELEHYIINYIAIHDQLPFSMKMDLFALVNTSDRSQKYYLHTIPLSYSSNNNDDDNISVLSQFNSNIAVEWVIARVFKDNHVISSLLFLIQSKVKDTPTIAIAMQILTLLTLDIAIVKEIHQMIPKKVVINHLIQQLKMMVSSFVNTAMNSTNAILPFDNNDLLNILTNSQSNAETAIQEKKGVEIFIDYLGTESSNKDPLATTGVLKLLVNMITPVQYRYNGNSLKGAERLKHDYQHHHQATINLDNNNPSAGGMNSMSLSRLKSKELLVPNTNINNTNAAMANNSALNSLRSFYTHNVNKIQEAVRQTIRQLAGITSLVQLIFYHKNKLNNYDIRLATLKALIGMASSPEINKILFKMHISTMLDNQLRIEESHLSWLEAGETGNAHGNNANTGGKRALMRYFSTELTEIIDSKCLTVNGQEFGSNQVHVHNSQELLYRRNVAEHSKITFDERELLDLIKEHLLAKGMTQTVACMEQELQSLTQHIESQIPSSAVKRHSTAIEMKTPLTTSLHKRKFDEKDGEDGKHDDEHMEENTLSNDLFVNREFSNKRIKKRLSFESSMNPTTNLTQSTVDSGSVNKENQSQETNININQINENDQVNTQLKKNSSISKPKLSIPLSKYARNKNIKAAMKKDSYANICARHDHNHPQQNNIPQSLNKLNKHKSVVNTPYSNKPSHLSSQSTMKKPNASNRDTSNPSAVNSRLSSIMQRYLRLQHQQCKHPITTLPTLSLTKPHSCHKPIYHLSSNILNILDYKSQQLYHYNTNYFNNYYMHTSIQHQYLRYCYSNFKHVQTVKGEYGELTATKFHADSSKLFLAEVEEESSYCNISLIDVVTESAVSQTAEVNLPGVITRLLLSPRPYSHANLTDNYFYHNQSFGRNPLIAAEIREGYHDPFDLHYHYLYLWKDTSITNNYENPFMNDCVHRLQPPSDIFSENRNDESESCILTSEFTCSGDHIVGLFHFREDINTSRSNKPVNAAIFDVNTGTCVQTIVDQSRKSMYDQTHLLCCNYDENLLFMDGKLYDLRCHSNQLIHCFDKLSLDGNVCMHPTKQELIIDHLIWDLRMFSLRQTVPLLEGCTATFEPVKGEVLFAWKNADTTGKSNDNANTFHVLDGQQYTHLQTRAVDKPSAKITDIELDPNGHGYLNCRLAYDQYTHYNRIFTIGRRRGHGDDDDEDEEDDDNDDMDKTDIWGDYDEHDDDDDDDDLDQEDDADEVDDDDDEQDDDDDDDGDRFMLFDGDEEHEDDEEDDGSDLQDFIVNDVEEIAAENSNQGYEEIDEADRRLQRQARMRRARRRNLRNNNSQHRSQHPVSRQRLRRVNSNNNGDSDDDADDSDNEYDIRSSDEDSGEPEQSSQDEENDDDKGDEDEDEDDDGSWETVNESEEDGSASASADESDHISERSNRQTYSSEEEFDG